VIQASNGCDQSKLSLPVCHCLVILHDSVKRTLAAGSEKTAGCANFKRTLAAAGSEETAGCAKMMSLKTVCS